MKAGRCIFALLGFAISFLFQSTCSYAPNEKHLLVSLLLLPLPDGSFEIIYSASLGRTAARQPRG